MDSARIAEWILALVIPPDRAATTLGDWMEDARERGPVWFWSCVFRTVAAQVWSDLTDDPVFLATLALRAFFHNIFIALRAFFLFCLVLVPVVMVLALLAHFAPGGFSFPADAEDLLDFTARTVGGVGLLVCLFQTGRWIAPRAPNRELAGCIAFCVVQSLLLDLTALAIMLVWGSELERYVSTHQYATVGTAFPSYLSDLFSSSIVADMTLFAGALWARRKTVRSTAG